jgi:AcrR family transcriptional regulator
LPEGADIMSEKAADRRTKKTKKAICNAFAELLCEKELSKITVKEIIDKADVSRVTFYNHYLDVYDLHDKFEENTMLEIASLILELESTSYEEVFSHLIEYVDENQAAFRMIFSPNNTSKMLSKLEMLLVGLLRQLYIDQNKASAISENVDYIIYYRAHGIISVIQKWVRNDFKERAGIISKLLTALDRGIEKIIDDDSLR